VQIYFCETIEGNLWGATIKDIMQSKEFVFNENERAIYVDTTE